MSNLTTGIQKVKNRQFDEAFRCFEEGYFGEKDTECACYLAQMYYDKRITPRTKKSLLDAMILWEITADKGKTSSKHKLGVNYYGNADRAVSKKGLNLIFEARNEGYDVSNCVLGIIAFKTGKYDEAIENFRKYQGIKSDPEAYACYGKCFIKKFDPDYKQAAKIFTDCFDTHANIAAAEGLLSLYNKDAVMEDAGKFFYYLRSMANLGDSGACEDIAIHIFNHDYEPPDASEDLIIYYLQKGESGLTKTGNCLYGEMLLSKYIATDDEKYYAKAKSCIEKSLKADSEYLQANDMMGSLLFIKERFAEAAYYYEKAYNGGFELSGERLFNTYRNMPDNKEKLYRCAKRLIESGCEITEPYVYSSYAFNIALGDFGEREDYAKAIELFIRAAKMGDVISMEMVGLFRVEYGDMATDIYTAKIWLDEAISHGSVDALYYLALINIQDHKGTVAVDYLSKAVDKGHAPSARKMAELYMAGYITGKKEKRKARQWEEIAEKLEQNNAR